jgi:uncharacterized protein YdcH (DUF465 family)
MALSRHGLGVTSKQVRGFSAGHETHTRGHATLQNSTGAASDNKDQTLSQLTAEHRALKARIQELNRHVSLTSAEQVEYSQLKKLKLRTKDRIRSLQRH